MLTNHFSRLRGRGQHRLLLHWCEDGQLVSEPAQFLFTMPVESFNGMPALQTAANEMRIACSHALTLSTVRVTVRFGQEVVEIARLAQPRERSTARSRSVVVVAGVGGGGGRRLRTLIERVRRGRDGLVVVVVDVVRHAAVRVAD